MWEEQGKAGSDMKYLFLLLVLFSALRAEVLQFFDPLDFEKEEQKVYIKSAYFIANDPVSLKELFKKWRNPYHPRNGDNLALQDFRVDLGGKCCGVLYVGYYYRYNAFIKTNRDFADFYYTAKNKKPFDNQRDYRLKLSIDGIKESGLLFSQTVPLFRDTHNRVMLGAAFSMAFGHDMQDGTIGGIARILDKKTYHIEAESRYHYTHNYLYHLDVEDANGFGFGTYLSLGWYNDFYQMQAKFMVNDLYSRMFWQDLPYSYVNIQTKNKSYDKDGYIKYNPTINGVEKYVDYTQKIEPRYKMILAKKLEGDILLSGALEYSYQTLFPSFSLETKIWGDHFWGITYETRFKTFGISYKNNILFLALSTDAFEDISAIGFSGGFQYRF
jgi:hypothetical protein